MTVGVCKFCGQEKELIASHIVPKVLYQLEKYGSVVDVDVKNTRIKKDPKHQNGVKEALLCKECDTELGYFDGYVNKVLNIEVPKIDKNKTFYDTPCICLPADKYNLDRLRRFFISLLWRSSICSRPISLGKYQDIALKILKNEIPDNTDLFLPLIYRRVGRGHVNNMTGIFGAKYLGKRAFIFRFPGYEVMIIINTLHSSSPQMMEIHRQQFSTKEALIFDIDYNTPLDYLLVSNLFKCRDNTPGLKRPPDYVPGQIPLPRRTFVLGSKMQNNLHIKSPYIILPKYDT